MQHFKTVLGDINENELGVTEEYKNLRVRVSGFSEYFVRLNEDLQDDVIKRTEQK